MEAMPLAHARDAILARARWAIANGRTTERGLARLANISQPHTHNLLSLQRSCGIELADRISCALDALNADKNPPPEKPRRLAAVIPLAA
jgi:hypothetical protein